MSEHKPNSYKSIEDKKIEKVVTGKVKTKKKTEVRKFADIFISEDIDSVKSYILTDVVIPAIKKAITDVIDIILYGETGHAKKSSPASRVSYGRYFDNRDTSYRNDTKLGYCYNDIILDSRGEAEEVLLKMDEIIETYGMVSVADLYEMVGITGRHTDNNYGWTNIQSASVTHTRDGYLLKFPKAIPLN